MFPHLTRIYNERTEKGLVVIGISVTDDPGLQDFVDQQGDKMGYTVAIDQAGSAGQLMKRTKIQGIPHAFIVGRDGKIAYRSVALPCTTVTLFACPIPLDVVSQLVHLTPPSDVDSTGPFDRSRKSYTVLQRQEFHDTCVIGMLLQTSLRF